MISFRRIFNPTPEEQAEDHHKYMKIHQKNIEMKACCTCIHYIIVPGCHPGFVTGADEDCDTGRCPIQTCEDYELDKAKERTLSSGVRAADSYANP